MQVKKFRGATTRDALEKIKQELGEDAFVLETKRVQSRGFLGLKSESLVEISAAAAPVLPAKDADEKRSKSFSILNLTDDTVAAPNKTIEKPEVKSDLIESLLERVDSLDEFEKTKAAQTDAPKFEAVEISTDAPRIVHPKKDAPKQKETAKNILSEEIVPAPKTIAAEASAPAISNREFELLRAELREVKFSLGAFAARQSAFYSNAINDFDQQGEVFDSPFYESFIDLTAAGIAPELARKLVHDVIPGYKNGSIKTEDIARTALLRGLSTQVNFGSDPLQKDAPSVLAIIGATGVGKTTTIAKLAARVALHENRRVELVTLDTYRIAAVEQLKTYAEIIGAGCHVVRSTLELDALLRRLPEDATVLIDTTGRSPHDLADQYELCDYLQRRREIRKCLAIQATTNVQDAVAAIRKFEMYGADCLAITKMDETTRPGAMLELAAEGGLPLVYFGIGQRVPEDLQIATPENFAGRVLGEKNIRRAFAANSK